MISPVTSYACSAHELSRLLLLHIAMPTLLQQKASFQDHDVSKLLIKLYSVQPACVSCGSGAELPERCMSA